MSNQKESFADLLSAEECVKMLREERWPTGTQSTDCGF